MRNVSKCLLFKILNVPDSAGMVAGFPLAASGEDLLGTKLPS